MTRLLWVAVGAATAVATARRVRQVADRHVPVGARSALGAAAGLTTLAHRAVAEFRTGTAEREAELRADLLAGADLPHARARVEAWRAERAARDAHEGSDGPEAPRPEGSARSSGPTAGATGSARPGSAASAVPGAGRDVGPGADRRGRGAHRAEDPDDGDLGYSFY